MEDTGDISMIPNEYSPCPETKTGEHIMRSDGSSSGSCESNSSDNSQKPLLGNAKQPNGVSSSPTKTHFEDLSKYMNPLIHVTKCEDENVDTSDIQHVEKQYDPRLNQDKAFWVKAGLVFSVLDVLLLATILVLRFGLPDESPTRIQTSVLSEYCLKCEDLYLSSDDMNDNIYNFNLSTHGECCSNNQTYIAQKYIQKKVQSYKGNAVVSASSYPTRATIHLDLDLTRNKRLDNTHQTLKWRKTEWKSDDLVLSENSSHITVKKTGLYFISVKVIFAKNTPDVMDNVSPMFLQVYRVNGSEHLLLESQESQCVISNTTCNIPSSAQGVFRFDAEESVCVKVVMPCGLKLEENLNNFDMYLI